MCDVFRGGQLVGYRRLGEIEMREGVLRVVWQDKGTGLLATGELVRLENLLIIPRELEGDVK